MREIVVTHPEFPSQSLSVEDQAALAERGALLERCFTTPHTGKITWERVASRRSAPSGPSTRCSRPTSASVNPPVEDGLALMADRLLEAGFDEEEVHTMAVANTHGASRGWTREPAPARDRRALGRLRLARRRRASPSRPRAGGEARVIALSYGERGESGELWKEPGQTVENVKQIRHARGRARRPPRSAPTSAASTSATTRSRSTRQALARIADEIREFAPDVLVTHTTATRSTPTTPGAAPRSTARGRSPPARASRARSRR